MRLNHLPYEREAEAEARSRSPSLALRLTEPVEDIRKEVRTDALPVISDVDSYLRVIFRTPNGAPSAPIAELDRIRQQVPEDLLEPAAVGDDRHRGDHRIDRDALFFSTWAERVNRGVHDGREIQFFEVQFELAGHARGPHDARQIQQ